MTIGILCHTTLDLTGADLVEFHLFEPLPALSAFETEWPDHVRDEFRRALTRWQEQNRERIIVAKTTSWLRNGDGFCPIVILHHSPPKPLAAARVPSQGDVGDEAPAASLLPSVAPAAGRCTECG